MVDHYEGEDVIITFEKSGAASVSNVTGQINSINISGGEENTEVRYAFGNKQILFGKPKEKFKVDFDVVLKNNGVFEQAFLGGATLAAGSVLKSASSQSQYRVSLWFVPYDDQCATHTMPPLTTASGRVMHFVDCRTVSFEKKFESDDILAGTISFEMSATDASGYSNYFDYYTNGTTSTLLQLTTTQSAEYRGTLTWTTAAFTGAYST